MTDLLITEVAKLAASKTIADHWRQCVRIALIKALEENKGCRIATRNALCVSKSQFYSYLADNPDIAGLFPAISDNKKK